MMPGSARAFATRVAEKHAAKVKRKIQADPRRVDEHDNLSHQGFVETVLKSANRLIRMTFGKNSGDAFLAGATQNGTQGRLAACELDLIIRSTGAVPARVIPVDFS